RCRVYALDRAVAKGGSVNRFRAGLTALTVIVLMLSAGFGPWRKITNAAARAESREDGAALQYFTDVALVDQKGGALRCYSDLLQDKTVIIIPFFWTGTRACAVIGGSLAKIQDGVGDRLGRDVYILSISVDPSTAPVPALQAYASQCHARPGWHF